MWAILLPVCLLAGVAYSAKLEILFDRPSGLFDKSYKQYLFLRKGERAFLKCRLEVEPGETEARDLKWFKEGSTGAEAGPGQTPELHIVPATKERAGNYTCKSASWNMETWLQIFVVDGESESGITWTVANATEEGVITRGLGAVLLPQNLSDTEIACKSSEARGEVEEVVWYFNGVKLGADTRVHGVPKVVKTDTLKITKPDGRNGGFYLCEKKYKGEDRTVSSYQLLEASAHAYLGHTSKNLMQGENAKLECAATGFPIPTVSWRRDKFEGSLTAKSGNRTNHYVLSEYEGIASGRLEIQNLEFDDRDDYYCAATNGHGSSKTSILLRVKDKLAALWPFLGIVAEVAILVTIIFLYEKRRARREAEEEGDAGEQKKSLTGEGSGGSEARQRAVKA